MTQADDRLLESLEGSNLVLSPRILAVNTDYSRHYVSERLAILLDAELVEKEDEGLYRITERGRAYLSGEIDADYLEDVIE
jgi:Mn-dependent DtxR family transcriptional regulator